MGVLAVLQLQTHTFAHFLDCPICCAPVVEAENRKFTVKENLHATGRTDVSIGKTMVSDSLRP